jgi:anti-sigma factor ChrR (cupin superfamily)
MTAGEDDLDDALIASIAGTVPAVEPRPSVRERLLAAARAERPEGFFAVRLGITGVRTSSAAWLPSPIPGIEYKLVARDADRGMSTRLVRFAAGARYPKHRHAGVEEIFLLEGSVQVNGTLLRAGDYCRSEPGTEESGTWSETGGLALIVSSDRDEIVADRA